MADWSNTLQNGWNALFNGTNTTSAQSDEKTYPICVIKTKDPILRRKRATVGYQYNAAYAGLAPNVVYPGSSYYGIPPYNGYPFYPPYREANGDDDTNDDDDNGEEINDDEDENIDDPEKNSNSPIINCVVVLRRENGDTIIPDADIDDEYNDDDIDDDVNDVDDDVPSPFQQPTYPQQPYPFPYPPQQTPQYPYPPPIPPNYPYPYASSRNYDDASFKSNQFPAIDSDAAVRYQEMIREYYKHLQAFYMADATTGTQQKTEKESNHSDNTEENGKKHV